MKPDVVLPFQGVGESGVPCSKGVALGYVVMPLWGECCIALSGRGGNRALIVPRALPLATLLCPFGASVSHGWPFQSEGLKQHSLWATPQEQKERHTEYFALKGQNKQPRGRAHDGGRGV